MTNKPQFVGEKIAFSDAFVEVSRGVKKIKQKDYLPAGDHPIIDQGQDAVSKPQFVGEKIAFSDAFVEVSRGVKKIKQKDYLPAGDHPIIDQGQDAVSGYACGEEGLFSDVPAIVFGDHTRCVKYVSEPFFAGADGVKILRPKQSDNVRFWWHALRTTRIENLGYSRHFKLLKESRFANYDEQDQRVICENLDRIMDEIDLASRQLAALDSLVKSRFVAMFGDPAGVTAKQRLVSIGSFTDVQTGATPLRRPRKPSTRRPRLPRQIPVCRDVRKQ